MSTASPCLAPDPSSGPPDAPAVPRVAISLPGDPRRAEVEAFIRDVYLRRYGARVRDFMPVLVCLREGGDIVAAAGYRAAGGAALFLERYLALPVETLLGAAQGVAVPRASIVEVGHLAAARAGEGRRLVMALGPHLAGQRFQWVVGTITQELRSLFLRIGVTPLTLGAADPAALGPAAMEWGSYYEHRPLVLAGHLPQVLRHLAGRPGGAAR